MDLIFIYIRFMNSNALSVTNPGKSKKRRSRMARTPTGKRLQLTQRDLAIFQLLTRYRFLRSTHLQALVGGKSSKRFIERLGALFHEGGYLDRPEAQWQTAGANYMPIVYSLSPEGSVALDHYSRVHDLSYAGSAWTGGRPGRHFLHELMVCDILSSIEIGTQAYPQLRFIPWSEILTHPKMPERTRQEAKPLAARVSVIYSPPGSNKSHRTDLPLIPDALFGLEYKTRAGNQYRFFALEADRTTQPIVRRNLRQSSYLRKILQYRELVSRSAYKTRWGLPNLLVLTVTTNERHKHNIMRMVREVTNGKGSPVLMFKTMPPLDSPVSAPAPSTDFLSGPWDRAGHPDFFIDQP
jgi:hypothetical protein